MLQWLSWCNLLQGWSTAKWLDAAEANPWRREGRAEDVDEEETAGKTGWLSETQRKPEGEGAQALFFNCNCGENNQQHFMSELIFIHESLLEILHHYCSSTETKIQESSSYSENNSGKTKVCTISHCLYKRTKRIILKNNIYIHIYICSIVNFLLEINLFYLNRSMLLEQYSQRTREAWSLVSCIPSSSAALLNSSMTEGPALPKTTRSSSAPPPNDRQRYPLWRKSEQELVLSWRMNNSAVVRHYQLLSDDRD